MELPELVPVWPCIFCVIVCTIYERVDTAVEDSREVKNVLDQRVDLQIITPNKNPCSDIFELFLALDRN